MFLCFILPLLPFIFLLFLSSIFLPYFSSSYTSLVKLYFHFYLHSDPRLVLYGSLPLALHNFPWTARQIMTCNYDPSIIFPFTSYPVICLLIWMVKIMRTVIHISSCIIVHYPVSMWKIMTTELPALENLKVDGKIIIIWNLVKYGVKI
jgi:hypothetical protein